MKNLRIVVVGAVAGALALPVLAQTPASPAAATASSDLTAKLVPGAKVFDPQGGDVGTIESVSGGNAVINTGTNKAALPMSGFAVRPNGVAIGLTKAQLDAAVQQAAVQAAAAVVPGASVSGAKGASVGTIESVDGEFAVLSTPQGKARLPLNAFTKSATGLSIGMTAAQLNAAIAATAAGGAS